MHEVTENRDIIVINAIGGIVKKKRADNELTPS